MDKDSPQICEVTMMIIELSYLTYNCCTYSILKNSYWFPQHYQRYRINSSTKIILVSTCNPHSRKHWTIETKCCCRLAETRMLNQYIPVWIVFHVIIIRYCQFHPPVVNVVILDVPMNSNRTHMITALNNISRTCLRWVITFSGFRE